MDTDTNYDPVVETKIRTERMGAGVLRIYSNTVDGKVVSENFTLESLATVLDMPMTTMNGRYARGQLRKWMVPIINGYGRPARGFPLELLQQVIDVVTTKGTSVGHDAAGSGVARVRVVAQVRDLVPTYHEGRQYYTVPALADAFNLSETTIRKKLDKAGMLRLFIDLGVSLYGGRPKRGIEAKHLGNLKMVLVHGFSRAAPRNAPEVVGAQEEMVSRIVPHVAPVGMQSYDANARAPVATVNAVKSATSDEVARDLLAELDSIMSPPANKVDQSLYAASAQPVDEETAANLKAGRAYQLQALTDDPAEPTDEELRDTTYSLSMSQGEADRFIAEVKAARAARGA